MKKSIAPSVALAGSLALTFAAAAMLWSNARARDQARFNRDVREAEARILTRFDMNAALLRGASAMMCTHPDTTPAGFKAYVELLDLPRHAEGVEGMGFIRRVRRADSPAIEAELQSRGFAGVRIWPDLGHEERSAVLWREPLDNTDRSVIGYDMLAEPVRREAMERARDGATVALSGKTPLVRRLEPDRPGGFVLFSPVYRGGAPPATVQQRREQLMGWMYTPFRGDDLFAAPAGETIDFQVYDGDAVAPARLLRDARERPETGSLSVQRSLEFAGRRWTLIFNSLPAFERGAMMPVVTVLVAGVGVSLFVFLLSLLEVRARARAEDAVAELRRMLDERDRFEERLREEGRVNSILRRLGISLAAELDPDRLAQLVVDEAMAITAATFGAMIDTVAPKHQMLAHAGTPPPTDLMRLESACEQLESGRVGDVAQDPHFAPLGTGSLMSVPIASRAGGGLGRLCFLHPAKDHFTEQHERLAAGLAAQASIALDNARLLRDVQESDKRKDEFLAVLGHELRNPLAPMVTALEVARRDPRSLERQLGIVERQAQHMVRIVDDLLDTSRISRGKIELRKQQIPVRDVLGRAADAVSPLAKARDQKLSVSLPARDVQIEADPVRLEQILGNLLSNAVKYTPIGGTVELSAAESGGWLTIRVRDTGIGVPREAQAKLFEPFVQVEGAKDYATGGLGIGLALVRGLVQLHGGTVAVESEGAGRGSMFTVRLPGAIEGATPAEVRKLAPRAAHGRVLLVDDNVDAALTLAEAVRLDGHEVRVAHEGNGALQLAADFAPDVVLLDIGLPGMDGYEVVRRLRQMPQLNGTLMVALTGFGQESDREKALKAGFDEHLVKPVDLDTVHAVLRRRLGAA
ncbi:MAG TPA: CHASE domain-containing protein [Myxococcales bacterium]|nr:CHASE domain-containing protein [Myxococcales bacterium]